MAGRTDANVEVVTIEVARKKVRAKRSAKKHKFNWDAFLLRSPWNEIAKCCAHYGLQGVKEQVAGVTWDFVRGYRQKPKPPKEAYHQASGSAKVIAKLAKKLGADIRKCREDAELAVLGRQEGDFDEEVDFYSEISRMHLSDPLRVELWWQYQRAFEKANSAKTILLEARRSLREINRQQLARGRPAHVAFDAWVGSMYGIWKAYRPERYSYNKRRYSGESLEFIAKVLNLVKPLLRQHVRETLPSGITEEASSEIDQREINAIGGVVHKLTKSPSRGM